MSILNGKNVLIVGGEYSLFALIKDELEGQSAKVSTVHYKDVTQKLLLDEQIDIILMDCISDIGASAEVLELLRTKNFNQAFPVFALIDDSSERIEDILSRGAADYLTKDEALHSILQKFTAMFGENGFVPSSSAIDITSHQPKITKKGIRVYVVEDDPLLRNLLSIRFDRSSFICEFSSDGQNVISAMKQFSPDIVLLDLMLPGKSGFDVLEEIRNHGNFKDMPVMVFSNRDGQSDRTKAKELGAVGFYVKALTDLSELVETIESHVK